MPQPPAKAVGTPAGNPFTQALQGLPLVGPLISGLTGAGSGTGASSPSGSLPVHDVTDQIPTPDIPGLGTALNDATDFLSFISWLFHPLNWLRMVEFLSGMLFVFFGLRTTMRGFRGSRTYRPISLTQRVIRRRLAAPIRTSDASIGDSSSTPSIE